MKNKDTKRKIILIICNIILIVVTLTATGIYFRHIYKMQEEAKTTDFIRTIESMKQVSQNYLNSERGYVKNWASYVTEHDMTMEEALDFLRSINTDKNRFVHIVDMDTFEAYSSYYPKGEEKIDTYLKYKHQNVESEEPFANIMQSMFTGTDDGSAVLGKYRIQETQATGIAVGERTVIQMKQGKKDYLMLRIIPTEIMRESWVFPLEYSSAEIGIITRSGDYVIQSPSMKSLNFTEYIRGYNFEDDYNEVEVLRKRLRTTDSGILKYKNFRGTDCLWYYSSFGDNSSLDILGVLSASEFKASVDAWYIILLVCGVLVVLVVIDGIYLISMNHRLREEARLSEQASRAKTQFLSAMSHDIRTPLNAVLGMMTIAQKRPDDAEYVVECMEKGIHSGKQLLTLINDVLDISKIESGKVTLNPEQVSLVEIMQNLVEMEELNITQKNIELLCEYDTLPYKYVLADRMRLNQIYVNLLTNAFKYTDDGGKITIRLYEEELKDRPADIRVIFYIEDTGIGMTEEFQKHMYSTFEREIKTQVNTTQGTGLGLSIVKQMVDLMNGTITCKSSPGNGTAFTVTIDFPVVEGWIEADTDQIEGSNIENMHLLVAEDNALNWEIFHELVSEYKITCDRAENGRECVNILKETPAGTYDAILMDVHMPVMNGLDATREIRLLQDEHIRHIPIIAMTADAFAEDVKKCMDAGMNGHIAKPLNMDKLIVYLAKIKNSQKQST